MATPWGFGLAYWEILLLQWTGGVATALMVRGYGGRPWHRAAGWGILSVPVWGTAYGILNSLSVLADSGSVLRSYARWELSWISMRKLLEDIGYLATGYLVWSWDRGRPWSRTPRDIAAHLHALGWPTGGRREWQSVLLGYVSFPLLAIGTFALYQAAAGIEALHNGDESSVWRHMSPYHVLLLSLAAGFGEELFYRGFLQTALARVMPAWGAIAVQAVFFGFAHAGYGTWIHVLGPVAFGLVAGVVAWRWGIWAATVLHVLIDVYAFGPFANVGWPWMGDVLVLGLYLNIAVALAWLVWRLRAKVGARTGA